MREQIKSHLPTVAEKIRIPSASVIPPVTVVKQPATKAERDQEDADKVTKASHE